MQAVQTLAPVQRETGATDTAVVQVRGVHKVYDTGTEALRDINLDFPRGALTSLLGPSGCGKTTLLKIIAGLIGATSGEVFVNGRRVTGPGPERAFVFQDFALMPWATVQRNVAFGLELRGVPQRERYEYDCLATERTSPPSPVNAGAPWRSTGNRRYLPQTGH